MNTLCKLKFESGEASLEFRSFSATEAMNTLFEVVVEAVSTNPDLSLDALIGKHASLAVESTPPRVWSGVVRRVGQMHGEDDPNSKILSAYKVHIAPTMWLLTLRRGHRIFQHLSIKEILAKVLSEGGVEFQDRLKETYPKLEYCVQYDETEFAFVSRLMERAGISYWFEQVGDKTLLTLDDRPTAGASKGVLPVREGGSHKDIRHVRHVSISHGVATGLVTTRDFDFRRPDFELFGVSDKAPGTEAAYEDYVYVPGHSLVDGGAGGGTPYADDKSVARHEVPVAKQDAIVRFGAHRARKRTVNLSSNAADLAVGAVFQVKDHPHPELEKPLLALRAYTQGSIHENLRVEITACFTDAPVRPYPLTPRPRIEGLQTAIVVGPPGQEIYTDEFGRARVKFHWDRVGVFDDNSTCWLRVSQMWAGPAWGGVLLPRVGHEVLVAFQEGDPDLPIIVGRLFNATAVVPYLLPENKPKSTWKSDTSPHQDNSFSEVMMDDAAGSELLFIQSQRDYRKLVKRHETERVYNNREHVVGKSRVAAVRELDGTQVGKRRLIQMAKFGDLEITTGRVPEVTTQETFIEVKDEHITLHTHKATVELHGAEIRVTADKGIRFTSESTLVIQGGPNVYFNERGATDAKHEGGDKFDDRVRPPTERVAPAIKDLLARVKPPDLLPPSELSVSIPPATPANSQAGGMAAAANAAFSQKAADAGAAAGAAAGSELLDAFLKHAEISGPPEFVEKVKADLKTIAGTKAGQELMTDLLKAKQPLSIVDMPTAVKRLGPDVDGVDSFCFGEGGMPMKPASNPPTGPVFINSWGGTSADEPDRKRLEVDPNAPKTPAGSLVCVTPSLYPGPKSPSDVILFHELTHANHSAKGESMSGLIPAGSSDPGDTMPNQGFKSKWTNQEEHDTIAKDNQYRTERGVPIRKTYNDFPHP